ncbi:MAG: hypothetical protein LBB75_09740 [Oscillospiraceae bacterium]|jgi:hypothetical protein|nr:hypothetical protein [Oscillospiraceae bacterium]
MLYSLVSEDAFIELSILREKAAVAINCTMDELSPRDQTLAYIASDYLSAMGKTIRDMQKKSQPLVLH